ncbi:hypothetical protein ACFL54_05820 [Planctomycetota bacterium]
MVLRKRLTLMFIVIPVLFTCAVTRLSFADEVAELTEKALELMQRTRVLIKDNEGKAVPVKVEKEIHQCFKGAIKAWVKLIEIDKSRLKYYQESLREVRCGYFWFRKTAQLESISVMMEDSSNDEPVVDEDEIRARVAREAKAKYEEAAKYEIYSPDDLWGIKARYQEAARITGTEEAKKAAEKVVLLDKKIAELSTKLDIIRQMENARTNLEKLAFELQLTAGSAEIQEIRNTVKDLVAEREIDLARQCIDSQITPEDQALSMRSEAGYLRDYLEDVSDLFVYALKGAGKLSKDKMHNFTLVSGVRMKVKILKVSGGKLTLSVPDEGISTMTVGLFSFNDGTVRLMARGTGLDIVDKFILGSYILTEEVKAAQKLLVNISDKYSWKEAYARAVEQRSRIAAVEKEIKNEKKHIKNLDKAFRGFLREVDDAKYEKSINAALAKIMKVEQDIRDEDIIRLSAQCIKETKLALDRALSDAILKCTPCGKTRKVTCPRCKGKGRIRRIGAGGSNAPRYVTCPSCRGARKVDCPFCYKRTRGEKPFRTLVSFTNRVHQILEEEKQRLENENDQEDD